MGLSSIEVSIDQSQSWPQTLSNSSDMSKPSPSRRNPQLQRIPEPLKCPRCSSTNTKFCYYNNYNKSQPRHFCKACKRHWTKGGTLRNVPLGGSASRKNKRPRVSSPAPPPRQNITGTDIGEEKIKSSIFYEALHETTPFSNNVAGLNVSSTEFQFTSLNTFEENSTAWIDPVSFDQSLNPYDQYTDGSVISTITTTDDVSIPSTSYGPWVGPDTSGGLDLPNYWAWSEIDVSADLNIPWDDDEDKNGEIFKP